MSDNGIPIIGEGGPRHSQVQTMLRKLHLEPNDIVVVRDQHTMDAIAHGALDGYSCGHRSTECKEHRILFAPNGIESVSLELLKKLMGEKDTETTQ